MSTIGEKCSEKVAFTGRTWTGLLTAIALSAGGVGGVQLYVGASDHDRLIAVEERNAAADKLIATNRDNINRLADTVGRNSDALCQRIEQLSMRIDRLLERETK